MICIANKESCIIRVGAKTKLLNGSIDLGKPCSRSLFETIQGMTKLVDIVWWMGIS